MSVNTALRTVEDQTEQSIRPTHRSDWQGGGRQVSPPRSSSDHVQVPSHGNRVLESARARLGLIDLDDLVSRRSGPSPQPDQVGTAPPSPCVRGWLRPVVPLVAGVAPRAAASGNAADLLAGPATTLTLDTEGGRQLNRSATPLPVRRTRVRATARGQVVAVVLLALLIVGISAVTNVARPQAETSFSTLEGSRQVPVTVQPGDTLFSIARRVMPTAEVAVVVAVIKSVNGLSDADASYLLPGQRLRVPTL